MSEKKFTLSVSWNKILWAEALKNLKQRSVAKLSQNLGRVNPWDQTTKRRKFMQMMCGTAVLFKKLLSVCQYHSNPCFNGYFVVIFHVLHTNKGSQSFFCVCFFSFLAYNPLVDFVSLRAIFFQHFCSGCFCAVVVLACMFLFGCFFLWFWFLQN